MADAYARLSHKPGVCECPSGAGSLYSVPGVAEANASSVPVILITSDIPLAGEGKQTITELDTQKLFESITKWSNVVKDVKKIPEVVRRAFRIATTGRPGAVHLALPQEVSTGSVKISESTLYAEEECCRYPAYRSRGARNILERLADLVTEARRLVIIAGGGANHSGANDAIRSIAEWLAAPVVTTISGVPAYCAASIAKSKPLQTGFEAFKLALAGFLIPYIFVYNQAMLMRGTVLEILTVTLVILVAIILFAGALSRYFFYPLNTAWQIIIFLLAGGVTFLCAQPDLLNTAVTRILGILILAGFLTRSWWAKFLTSKQTSPESSV
jgi:hypothetical protein